MSTDGAGRLAGLALRGLTARDLPSCARLSASVGWNQTEGDWRLFLDLGQGVGLFSPSAGLVGTACLLPYGATLAWISMVIVAEGWQRRGLATHMVEYLLCRLADQRLLPVLDATPVGRPVYERLGFQAVAHFRRWGGVGEARASIASSAQPIPAGALGAIARLDARAFGADRLALLERLYARCPEGAFAVSGSAGPTGYVLAREGRLAQQIGPLVAEDIQAAQALLAAAVARVRGPILIDLPVVPGSLESWMHGLGFAPHREFCRMVLGGEQLPGSPALVYAHGGPEIG